LNRTQSKTVSKFGEIMLQHTELQQNILLQIKLFGWENMENHGSSNLNYHTVLIKPIMLIKDIPVTELDQMLNTIVLTVSEPTPTSEITQFKFNQVSLSQMLLMLRSLMLSLFSFTVVQMLILKNVVFQSQMLSTTLEEVFHLVLTIISMYALIPMVNSLSEVVKNNHSYNEIKLILF